MNRIFTVRSALSLALLFIAAMALIDGIKNSVTSVVDAAFLPVAIFATAAGYLLGFTKWSTRRAWSFILVFGLLVIFLEASRVREVLWQTMLHVPGFEISLILAKINKLPLPTSFLQIQLDETFNRMTLFLAGLTPHNGAPSLVLRELFWDMFLLIFCAWSGWWSSRHNQILTALGPSLALHAIILNYTGKSALSLQIAAFAFIFLLGIRQSWSVAAEKNDESSGRVRTETYITLFILSFVLALVTGWAPVFSVEDAAKKIAEKQNLNDTLGLEKKVAQSYTVSSSGLPREHLIDTPPQNLMAVVFVANTGERPALDETTRSSVGPHHYWRWLTYDLYNGNNWSTTPVTSNSYAGDVTLFEYTGTDYQIIHQTIKKSSAQDSRLYWTGYLIRASEPFESTWRVQPTQKDPLLNMDMLGSLTQATEYSADSLVPQLNETQLREAPLVYPRAILDKYLSLPKTISPRVLELSRQLTLGPKNAYDKAKAIEAYLRTYPYTLDVPAVPPDKEIADYFLFEIKKGYCDYYATSMVVLARAAGLPARLVIGYSSGDYDNKMGQYTVREANAHSWVEIYFPTIGWVEFEPTANQPVIERPLTASASEINVASAPSRKERIGITYAKKGRFVRKNILLPISLFTVLLSLIGIWILRTQGYFFSYTTIGGMYEYVYYHGRKIYTNGPLNETPTLFAENLKIKLGLNRRLLFPAAGELDQLTLLYLKETYSPHPITKNEQEQAVKIWRKLFWRLLYARTISL